MTAGSSRLRPVYLSPFSTHMNGEEANFFIYQHELRGWRSSVPPSPSLTGVFWGTNVLLSLPSTVPGREVIPNEVFDCVSESGVEKQAGLSHPGYWYGGNYYMHAQY